MSSLTIDGYNRQEVQAKYIDSLISRMDFMETRYALREFLNDEKSRYSDDDLLDEIKARGPDYINDVFSDSFQEMVVLS